MSEYQIGIDVMVLKQSIIELNQKTTGILENQKILQSNFEDLDTMFTAMNKQIDDLDARLKPIEALAANPPTIEVLK